MSADNRIPICTKDKRIVDDSLDAMDNNCNENGVYNNNNVLIIKEIVPSLNEPERLRVRNEVVRSVPSSYVKYARTG